jgi:hypothetical protein
MFHALLTDAQFNSIALVIIAVIGIIPATLAAIWSRSAKHNSSEAKDNAAGALHEVKANGGMSDPDPTLKDYIKFVGESVEQHHREIGSIRALLDDHLKHSKMMDIALAEVFFEVKGIDPPRTWTEDND